MRSKLSSTEKWIPPSSYLCSQFSMNRSDGLDLVQFPFEYISWFGLWPNMLAPFFPLCCFFQPTVFHFISHHIHISVCTSGGGWLPLITNCMYVFPFCMHCLSSRGYESIHWATWPGWRDSCSVATPHRKVKGYMITRVLVFWITHSYLSSRFLV